MGIAAGCFISFGPEPFTFVYDHWVGLITASLSMSVLQGVYCYVSSFFGDKLLALGGNSGNPIYDVRCIRALRLSHNLKTRLL